jgi:hypothetical protein
VLACALALAAGGVVPAQAPAAATAGLAALATLSAVGLGQLLVAVRRDLAAPGTPPAGSGGADQVRRDRG